MALRGSVWLYPLVNAVHIVGIALLFGAIVSLDLRLLGAFASADIGMLERVLVPVAVAGLVLAIAAGGLLFVTDARNYAGSNLFRAKMVVILLALANAGLLRRRSALRLKLVGGTSIGLWLSAIVLGRLVGYF